MYRTSARQSLNPLKSFCKTVAIRDLFCFLVIPLMVILCRIKPACFLNRCLYFQSLAFKYGFHIFSRFFLCVVKIKYRGSVLTAYVRSLPVQLRWIVNLKKHLQQIFIINHSRIIHYFQCFRMPCFSGTNLLISGINCMPAGISNRSFNYSRIMPEKGSSVDLLSMISSSSGVRLL